MEKTGSGAVKRRILSETATRLLRGIIAEQGDAGNGVSGAACLLKYVGNSEHRLYDALLVLEGRWLITWERGGQRIRPRARAFSLLREHVYRERGLL